MGGQGPEAAREVAYVHLWASADGETHLEECAMGEMRERAYSNAPQVRPTREGLPGVPEGEACPTSARCVLRAGRLQAAGAD